jgi:hypothetical protein
MFVKDYLADLTETINDYTTSGFIVISEITSDFRSDKIGIIHGKIVFVDESILFFKEYLDLRHKIDKKAYSFHYQDRNNNLIFRYDNAWHKPRLAFSEHKHTGNKIIPSSIPDVSAVLEEIMTDHMKLLLT